jgi:glutamate synthase domain-containing protein 3
MGKSWFRTADQDKYLEEQVKELIKARLDETVKSFRHQLYEKWEARWPEIEVLYPQRTDADPPLTKEQLDELSKAMGSRKLVSLKFLL